MGPLKALLIRKRMTCFYLFLILIFSPFFIRDISQVFFSSSQVHFPVNISLFVCFCVFFYSVSYIALRVTGCDGQNGRPSINSLCHTGNAGGGAGRG